MPHLYFDGSSWWMYLAQTNPADDKLAIYRARQNTTGNWNDWSATELVVAAGSSVGVGEPTLTAAGDLSFTVVTRNTVDGTATDLYDSDPWLMRRR